MLRVNKGKQLLLLSFMLILFLSLGAEATLTASITYSDIVEVGNSFEWVVKKYDVSCPSNPLSEDKLHRGDRINVTIIAEPALNATDLNLYILGLGAAYDSGSVEYRCNDIEFNKTGFALIPYPFFYGWIRPFTFIDQSGSYNYFDLVYDINEDITGLDHTLTEEIYEYSHSYETTTMISKVYLKYDVQTGILLRCEEELKLKDGDFDAEVIFSYGGDITLSVNYDTLSFIVVSLFISLIVISRKKRYDRLSIRKMKLF